MDAPRVQVQGVSKRYLLGEHHGSHGTLRDAMASSFNRVRRRERVAAEREIWSLRDVTLEIGAGESLGVVGRNGAGKSTLLKLITRITEPTSGRIRTRGRVGSLLEVGTGFHDELTGRENVYLNGAILGMRRRDIDRRFDEIAAFAGVDRFLDTPVKRYSSGMAMRLAFAVAAHLDTDIMIVDEVLAVGDGTFQRKCLTRMGALEKEGTAVVFVSHNLEAIARLCRTTAWLEKGELRAIGPTAEVIDRYVAAGVEHTERRVYPDTPDQAVSIRSAAVLDSAGRPAALLPREEPFEVEIRFTARERIPALDLSVLVEDFRNVRVIDEAWSDDDSADRGVEGEYVARVRIPPILPVGDYTVGIWIGAPWETFVFDEAALQIRLDGSHSVRNADRVVQLGLGWQVGPAEGVLEQSP